MPNLLNISFYKAELENRQILYGPQSLKFLLSGPLQKRFAKSCLKVPTACNELTFFLYI